MTQFSKKIMIIDDDSVDRFILRKVIKSVTQAEIMECESGNNALEKLAAMIIGKETLPDLIFLDIKMPSLDGFEFLNALKQLSSENKNHCRIVLITSVKNEVHEKNIHDYGNVVAYLEKPVKKQSLLELKKHSSLRQAS